MAAALTQSGIVSGRVRDPMPLLWDALAPLGVDFERHANTPQNVTGVRPRIILIQPIQQRALQQSVFRASSRKRFAARVLRRSESMNSISRPVLRTVQNRYFHAPPTRT